MTDPELSPTGAPPAPAERPLRAHALRNRERLLATARDAFSVADDTVPLESIARDAGVGIGTLYRHFPTREALVEAVYAAELDALVASAPTLLEDLPPEAALRAWMDGYAQFFATKRGMKETLRAGVASGRIATPATRERVTASIGTILAAGVHAGSFRPDVEAEDVTVLLLGVFLSSTVNSSSADAADRTGRLLDLIIDALRPQPSS